MLDHPNIGRCLLILILVVCTTTATFIYFLDPETGLQALRTFLLLFQVLSDL